MGSTNTALADESGTLVELMDARMIHEQEEGLEYVRTWQADFKVYAQDTRTLEDAFLVCIHADVRTSGLRKNTAYSIAFEQLAKDTMKRRGVDEETVLPWMVSQLERYISEVPVEETNVHEFPQVVLAQYD